MTAGRRPGPWWWFLAVVVAAAVLGAALGIALWRGPARPLGHWVQSPRSPVTVTAVQALLDRRASAVRARDRTAFLADVDTSDSGFVRRQAEIYENLVRMPLDELSFSLESTSYASAVSAGTAARFRAVILAPGVTIRYRVSGVDLAPVTVPWVPVFGYTGTRWLLAEEAAGRGLPYGVHGQPWDAGPIRVVVSRRTVTVVTEEDSARADYLVTLAERSLDRVHAVRPTGWSGSVLVTAVQDRRIFDTYFATAPDRIADVAAIAVPYYDRVPDWHTGETFATTRVVFNPDRLSAQPEELAHDLTHEFTHVAMGPVTTDATPRWLVEGLAEYVAYRRESVAPAVVRKALREAGNPESLPADATFYSAPVNYVTSWLACQMLVDRFGEAKLLALYAAFRAQPDQSANLTALLGLSLTDFTRQWRDYLRKRSA